MKWVIRWVTKPRRKRKRNQTHYHQYLVTARNFVNTKLEHFNQVYGFRYQRVSIRNQVTRWGSCSKSGNLNFNYRLVLIPPELADYVIVHELCHLQELNHSANFWKLVAQTIPDYKLRRAMLKRIRLN